MNLLKHINAKKPREATTTFKLFFSKGNEEVFGASGGPGPGPTAGLHGPGQGHGRGRHLGCR